MLLAGGQGIGRQRLEDGRRLGAGLGVLTHLAQQPGQLRREGATGRRSIGLPSAALWTAARRSVTKSVRSRRRQSDFDLLVPGRLRDVTNDRLDVAALIVRNR